MATNKTGRLYVVGTPIGNLQDLSSRAVETLRTVDLIAAEDTRRTGGLLSSIGVDTPLISCHDHNEAERVPVLLDRLCRGERIALVSDAGMPLISDPGWRFVKQALEAGMPVVSVPGPTAATAALSVAGLPTDRFVFEGFLPRRGGQRSERLRELRDEPRTLIFYESVHRLERTMQALAAELGGERRAVLARELTKLHEAVYAGSLAELTARLGADLPLKGEFVVVVAGRPATAPSPTPEVRRIFELLREQLPVAAAVALTARITGLSRNEVYRLTRID